DALQRRGQAAAVEGELTGGGLSLNLLTHEGQRAGQPIRQQPRELRLLEYLMRHANQLENATKFTPENGEIRLKIEQKNGHAIISVSDSGPGIPVQEREHVLQRFVRLDTARSKEGNGLGLSLVNAVALLHKAELTLEDNHPGLKISLIIPQESFIGWTTP
ncbi:MAG TPA: GHKL domain-containing protein, partial [Gammaproteobacteria bacterium]|nr:GHKL domain-containing protein [Gammaproteobacteria bacterium]